MFARHGFEPVWSGWFGWFLPLMFLALLVAIGIALYYLFRHRPASTVGDDPLRRAARRYANGELERVEFERVQRDLGGPAGDPLRDAALRLARGEMTVAEFDEIRGRLSQAEGEAGPDPHSDEES